MIDLDDNRWATFEGGYRQVFDASVALKELEASDAASGEIWETLWEELYHQGDVGVASYAAIPQLVRIYEKKQWLDSNLFMFAAKVEQSRHLERNPPVPEWLEAEYKASLVEMIQCSSRRIGEQWDFYALLGVLMLLCLVQGKIDLAELLNYIDEGEEKKLMEKMF